MLEFGPAIELCGTHASAHDTRRAIITVKTDVLGLRGTDPEFG